MRRAAKSGARLVALPEMCTTGFTMDAERWAEPFGGADAERLKSIARVNGVWLIAGIAARSPDGAETWIVYHANSSAGQGCGTTRTTRAQKIGWNADGTPNPGTPVRTGVTIAGPSGDS